MKFLDVLILLAVIWFAIKGFKNGFFGEIFFVLALIIGGWATVHFTDYTCSVLHWTEPNKWMFAAGITFVVVVVGILLLGRLCKSIFSFVLPDFFDKLLGLVFGGGKIILLVGILFYFVSNFDTKERVLTVERKSASFFYAPSLAVAEFVLPQFKKLKESDFLSDKTETDD